MKKMASIVFIILFCFSSISLVESPRPAYAVPVTVPGVPGYGYNVIPAPDGQPGAIGCGPTTGAMILDYYDNTVAPGLISNPLSDARLLGSSTYMKVNSQGFGSPSDFHFGLEDFAKDRGYLMDAVLHVEPTTFDPAGWPGYSVGQDIATDATFWNTANWSINAGGFLSFLQAEIDAGRPVSITVDSDGLGGVDNSGFFNGTDHWMAGVGYDSSTNQWAGYNTWDNSLHWYDVTSAFHTGETQTGGFWADLDNNGTNETYLKQAGNIMGIGYVRTFTFEGPIDQNGTVPEPSTMLLLGCGFLGLVGLRRKFRK